MFKKRCKSCSEGVDKSWNFCPNCGNPVKAGVAGANPLGVDLNKMFQQMVTPLLNNLMGGVAMNANAQNKRSTGQNDRFSRAMTNIKEVVEPEDIIEDMGDMVTHSISLPGVDNKTDVNVTKMENSIEVRAITGKKMYLKIIKRDRRDGIVSEDFFNENLVLVLRKTN